MIWLIAGEVVSSHPFSKMCAGWKGVIDHSLHESLKTSNSGKQSKVTMSLSHLGPFENRSVIFLFWKELPPKFQLLLGKYNTILAAPQQRALTSAGLFLQWTPHPPLFRWIKPTVESHTEGFLVRFPERLVSSQVRNTASTATLWHWSICTFSPGRQQEAQSQARI